MRVAISNTAAYKLKRKEIHETNFTSINLSQRI